MKSMNKNPLLSIIIPAYNSGQYLERCVSSCERQNISEEKYEILIVNDGSHDNTLDVAEDLARKYGNIKVLTKENGGSSSARNMGLDHAEGHYITFVDADDCLLPDKLNVLLSAVVENHLDVCFYSMKVMKADGSSVEGLRNPLLQDNIYSGEEAILAGLLPSSACCIIYSKELLDRNNIRFNTNIIFGEDTFFSFQVFLKSKRMMNTNICAYIYKFNPQSVSKRQDNQINKEIKKWEDSFQFMKFVETQSDNKENSKMLRQQLKEYYISLHLGFLKSMIDSKILSYKGIKRLVNDAQSLQLYPCVFSSTSFIKRVVINTLNNKPIFLFILWVKHICQ